MVTKVVVFLLILRVAYGAGLTCYNGTSLDGTFSDFLVSGCQACTKTVANYKLQSRVFSYFIWSGIGCTETTANWTATLAKPKDPSECGVMHSMANDGLRAALLNESYNCSEMAVASASAVDGKTTWKSTCVCCSTRCNEESLFCNDNKTVDNFQPLDFIGGKTLVDMSTVRKVSGDDTVGLTCFSGTNLDGTGPSELAMNCSACTKHIATYTFMGFTSAYTTWGGIGCTKLSPLSQMPDYSTKCFTSVFGPRLSTSLVELEAMKYEELNAANTTATLVSCNPSVIYSKTSNSDGRIVVVGCTCCTNNCNDEQWTCGDNSDKLFREFVTTAKGLNATGVFTDEMD